MDIKEKERLARRLDDSVQACAWRLRAALIFAGVKQKEAAEEIGLSETALSNAKKGLNYPSLPTMRWLYRQHRIDFNFLMAGEFSQLPSDVQLKLFDALATLDVEHASDQTPS